MTIEYGFEIIGNYSVTKEVEKPNDWEELSIEEKLEYLKKYDKEMFQQAEKECPCNIGDLEYISIDNEEYWLH